MGLLRNVTGTRSLRAASGQQMEVQTVTGPTSYTTGGISVTSNLGRVDEFTVQTPSDSVISKNHTITSSGASAGSNIMVSRAYSIDSGSEFASQDEDQNLSQDEFIFTAYKL